MFQINQCLHTAILVSDLERAEYFYSQVLGLAKIERVLRDPGAWYALGDYQIHLIVSPDFQVNEANPEKWGKNPHIALGTSNLEATITKLQEQGYPLQMSASGRKALFVKDPDGNIIEISQINS